MTAIGMKVQMDDHGQPVEIGSEAISFGTPAKLLKLLECDLGDFSNEP
jgi:hypothetical protein